MHTIIIVEFVLYCVAMLGIGVYFSRRDLSHSDFLLGGKKLPVGSRLLRTGHRGICLAFARLHGIRFCYRAFGGLGRCRYCIRYNFLLVILSKTVYEGN